MNRPKAHYNFGTGIKRFKTEGEIIMSPEEKKKVAAWGDNLSKGVTIDLVMNATPESYLLEEFCRDLSCATPAVEVNKTNDPTVHMPYIKAAGNVTYHAVPLGKELAPFLGVLTSAETAAPPLSETSRSKIKSMVGSTALRLYITPACPFCPSVVEKLTALAQQCEQITLSIIDGTLFQKSAEQDRITSAPTLVYNESFRWTGAVNMDDVVEIISSERPYELSSAAIKTMLEEGNASVLAALMVQSGTLFPAIFDLLTHEKWPTRLGAMVAMEEVAAMDKQLASTVIDPLWEIFPEHDETIKGDIIYIIGESGDETEIPNLESIIAGDYSKAVKEAAKDAIENINGEQNI